MPASKKPRKKYNPAKCRVLVNPLGYVMESLSPLKAEGYAQRWSVEARTAWARICSGAGTFDDANRLMAAHNISEALVITTGYPDDTDIMGQSLKAVRALMERGNQIGRLVPTGPEIAAVNTMLELQDEFMDCITVAQMERAHRYAVQHINAGHALPKPL